LGFDSHPRLQRFLFSALRPIPAAKVSQQASQES
jgi:hypothetical protein